jgi:hypothetical protein
MPRTRRETTANDTDPPPVPARKTRAKKPADASVKVKTSSFHITMNTNQRYTNKEALRLDMRPLWDALQTVYGTPAAVEQIVEIMTPLDTFAANVGSVSSESGIEYAESGLHSHTLLTLNHTTRLRMNLKALRSNLQAALPHLTSFYLNVRFVPNQVQTVKNYIYKQVNGVNHRLADGTEYRDDGGVMECKCERKIGGMGSFFSEG